MTDPAPDFKFPPVRELLNRLGVQLSKHKSQHFLVNPAWCERIAGLCGLTAQHAVVEIGTGLGNLTTPLARSGADVFSVEMDDSFAPWHAELCAKFPNLRIIDSDFLKVDVLELLRPLGCRPFVAAGNLPYQITGPALFKLIECGIAWERIVVMVQLEVAERLAAGPGTRQASALTYKIALEYEARIDCRLGPKEFFPPPRVDSAVVVLEPRADCGIESPAHKARLYRVITAMFQHRRRTGANGLLLGGIVESRDRAEAALVCAGIDPKARPETFGVAEFLRLDEALRAEGVLQ